MLKSSGALLPTEGFSFYQALTLPWLSRLAHLSSKNLKFTNTAEKNQILILNLFSAMLMN